MAGAITGPREWAALQEATGTTEAVADPAAEFGGGLRRRGGAPFRATDRLCEVLAPWFVPETPKGASFALEPTGVCWGPYRTVTQMLAEDPRCSTANPLFLSWTSRVWAPTWCRALLWPSAGRTPWTGSSRGPGPGAAHRGDPDS
ncbi:MAG: hypothetical protein Ct9H300mP31_15320 [Acidimicrobiaceae bacterium]|nr:MAG: hypothetical protein Ct9H300mP31_15320 [Acidimicrobiaceae bacterium]